MDRDFKNFLKGILRVCGLFVLVIVKRALFWEFYVDKGVGGNVGGFILWEKWLYF